MSIKLSGHQIKVLSCMAKLLKNRSCPVIRPKELARYLKRNVKAIEGTLLRLRDKGVVENVGFGAWRITEAGWKTLRELGYEEGGGS